MKRNRRNGLGLIEVILVFGLLSSVFGPFLRLLGFSHRRSHWEKGRVQLYSRLRQHQLSVLAKPFSDLQAAAYGKTSLKSPSLDGSEIKVISTSSRATQVRPGLIEIRSRIEWISKSGQKRITEIKKLRARRTISLETNWQEDDS